MLRSRILTASLLIPLVILAVLFLQDLPFAVISGLVFLLGLWEWTTLAGFNSRMQRVGSLLMMAGILFILMLTLYFIGEVAIKDGIPLLIITFWFLVLAFIIRYPKDEWLWKTRTVGLITGVFVLIPPWLMLNGLRYQDRHLVLYLLVLIWAADIAAYFSGKRFGQHKLAAKVSPGKSWEGVVGALLSTILVSGLAYLVLQPNLGLFPWISLALITIIFSIVGDLFESSFKRMRNLKDSGTLLPGHGGLLDRIDSLTAAIPIFTIGLLSFGA